MTMIRRNAVRRAAMVLIACVALVGRARAETITLTASDDTFITIHPDLGGSGSTHGGDTTLYAIRPSAYEAYPLIKFDLSAYAGQTVGPATFSMYVKGTYSPPTFPESTRSVFLYEAYESWSGATATSNNFDFTSVYPDPIGQTEVLYPGSGDRYVSWAIGASVIQGWIDNPSTNHGLMVMNIGGVPIDDLQFGSLESDHAPKLEFAVVPLPSSAAGGHALLAGMAVMKFRRRHLTA